MGGGGDCWLGRGAGDGAVVDSDRDAMGGEFSSAGFGEVIMELLEVSLVELFTVGSDLLS